ncbi:peptidase, partial [Vibrio campbellii]
SFSAVEKHLLEEQLKRGRLLLRIQGPTELPVGNDSQMMQFDIGYGRFGGGIHYRPSLYVIYQRKPTTVQLTASMSQTFERNTLNRQRFATGYDEVGGLEIGQMV